MPTIYEITEPKDAWGMVSHFLGNDLLSIHHACENVLKRDPDQQANDISHIRRGLIGGLYVLVHRMDVVGHGEVAEQIQQILDMVVEQDVTDPAVRKAIHDKHMELNEQAREFTAALAQLREQHKR